MFHRRGIGAAMSFLARASVFSARIVDGQARLDDRPLTLPNHSVTGNPHDVQTDCRLAVKVRLSTLDVTVFACIKAMTERETADMKFQHIETIDSQRGY